MPALDGRFDAGESLRSVVGIGVVGGGFVTATIFFGAQRIWRHELPRYFPPAT